MKNMFKFLTLIAAVALFEGAAITAVYANDNVEDDTILVAEELNAIHFPMSLWDTNLLQIIEDGPNVLSPDEELVLQPHPQNNSATTKSELEYLFHIAATQRSEEVVERILYENTGVRVFEIFQNEKLIPEGNYKAIDLLELVDGDFMYFTLSLKKHFSRPRPSQLAMPVLGKELPLAIQNPGHAAYPSGHAGQTYMVDRKSVV